ncbi:MAG: C10 family peptidase [Bacteroidales bacterium]|nr:C10 family peptidase [Bacteroidales bacterium]
MNAKFLLFAILFVFSFSIFAENVPIQKAERVALNFYFEKYNRFEGQVSYDQLLILSAYTETDGIENFYHVFHINQGGFVIVSADDRLNPVLGYSFENDFGFENRPPNVQWWFQNYVDQVKYAREKQIEPASRTAELWDYYLEDNFKIISFIKDIKAVEPLITTLWDQGWPYNYYCPETSTGGSGGHTWAGCVATAAAQVAYYWRWPSNGQGYTSYIPPTHPEYGMQSANFGETWYRFHEMCDDPGSVNLAIAEYIYQTAVGLHMDFAPGGSAPSTGDSLHYFTKFFPYQWIERDTVPDDEWKGILINNLDNKYPLYYSGSPSSGAGHAFVCDGYQDEEYFHFNLGWGGSSNGYYSIDNILGYNFGQSIVQYICPDTLQYSYPVYCGGADTLNYFEGSICDASGPLNNYPDNTQASWLIDPQTEMDSITNITIALKRFDLYEGDLLNIYDGEDNTAPLLAGLTGSSLPDPITSTGNKVFIEFITDGQNTAEGFYLNYTCEQPDWCAGMTQVTEPAATFDDGSGDFYYYNGTTCMWLINPGINHPLTLGFNYFNTEEINDKLKIYDADTQELLAEISGEYETPPPPVTSPSGKMMLAFQTSSSVRNDGWEVTYNMTALNENLSPFHFSLQPNPASGKIKITYTLHNQNQTIIELTDITGKKVKRLQNEVMPAGNHSINCDIDDLPQGIYFCQLRAGNEMITKKIVKL